MPREMTFTEPPRIEYLKVANFRALHDVELKDLTPMTVLLGPNGSGKSTVFDVFAFLAECFQAGLRRAWDRRGRARELKTRGAHDARTRRVDECRGVSEFIEAGASLGDLWMENLFGAGDPLTHQGAPAPASMGDDK